MKPVTSLNGLHKESGCLSKPRNAPETPAVSVVLPVYGCRECLPELYTRLRMIFETQGIPWEAVFVDDACPDGSLAVLRRLASEDCRVVVIALARNGGQHRAVLVGLRAARAPRVVVMDADLQDPPEMIPALLAKLSEGYAAVFAGRHGRYESAGRLLTSRLYKRLLRVLIGVPSDAGLFVALSHDSARKLVATDVRRPNLIVMIGALSRPVISVSFLRSRRANGASAYSGLQRLSLGLHALLLATRWRWNPPCPSVKPRPWEGVVKETINGNWISTEPRLGERPRPPC